jgi:hypothetical protein
MRRLSSGMTTWYRVGAPIGSVVGAGCVFMQAPQAFGSLTILFFAASILWMAWFGWRLSDVWLDDDVLQVKRPGASFRVLLADVTLLDTSQWGRGLRMFVLDLDHPIGNIQKVRFVPEGAWVVFGANPADALEMEIRTIIHKAKTARKA